MRFALALLVAAFPFIAQAQVPGSGVSSFGAITPGNCVEWKASGVVMDSGAACGGGGGGIPAPGPTTLGGLFSHSAVTHQFLTGIGLDGTVSAAQPGIGDITGLGSAAALNVGTSGAAIPLLNGVNTWSQAQTFGAVNATTVNGTVGNLGLYAPTGSSVSLGVNGVTSVLVQPTIVSPTTNNAVSLGTTAL